MTATAGRQPAAGKGADGKEGKAKNYRLGHRQRLRDRFRAGGEKAVQDYELIEMLLFHAVPRRDVKDMAKEMLDIFRNFNGVLSADEAKLRNIRGVGAARARRICDEFRLFRAIALKMQRDEFIKRPVLSSWRAVVDYVVLNLGHKDIEQFDILFLDRKNRLMRTERHQHGTVDHTPVYPREVMRRALELGASALVLVHHHPSGDPSPSRADIDMTRQLIAIGQPLGVSIHDHLVVAQGRYASFKELGLI